jgi:hypothetical protein
MTKPHHYTDDQKEFIRQNAKGISGKELADRINKEFGIQLSVSQVNSFKKNYKIKSGLSGCFQKGQESWNKGRKYPEGFKNSGQFEKSKRPHNYKPIGTERINGDGYVDVKIADPGKWKGKHKIIWEELNGPIPKDHVVIFADGNKLNLDIENLLLITRRQLMAMNRYHLITDDIELTKTGVIVAKIHEKIAERRRK